MEKKEQPAELKELIDNIYQAFNANIFIVLTIKDGMLSFHQVGKLENIPREPDIPLFDPGEGDEEEGLTTPLSKAKPLHMQQLSYFG
jgi:hypothetical protein